MNGLKVSDVMTHLVVTLRPQDKIQDAARRLLNNRISGAPVVEGGKLVGIVSEADLVAAYEPPARSRNAFVATDPLMFLLTGRVPRHDGNLRIRDVMTTSVVSIGLDSSLYEAARLIDRHGIRRLPVVDPDGNVVGVLARADLVRAMARSDKDIAGDARAAVLVMGEENFSDLEIDSVAGEVTVSGTADRKSTHDIALRAASRVPGVLRVVDALGWRWDDSHVKPVHNPRDPYEIQRDPWAVGPLVKEETG